MKAIIRISGQVKVRRDMKETLDKMRLRRKFVCILLNEKDAAQMGMLKKIRNFVAFGDIERGVLLRLIDKRGQLIDKKVKKDPEKVVEGLEKGKSLEELGLKPFFRLHPPRGGIKDSKQRFPDGVLGNNHDKINKLIEKML